jgi:hypothetical protein
MSTSKFNELVEIVTKDYEETTKYLKRNCEFINQLTQKLSDYIECGMENLFCYILENNKASHSLAKLKIQDLIIDDSIKITKECIFVFPLLIQIKQNSFNNEYCSPSFKKNQLTPPSQVVLALSIYEDKENSFVVIAPGINQIGELIEEKFLIDLTIDDPWIEFLESCFKVIKKTIEGGLKKRISESVIDETDNSSKRAFGISINIS